MVSGMWFPFQEEADALAKYLGTKEPKGTEVENSSEEDAADEQQQEILYPAGGEVDGNHRRRSNQKERQDVFQGGEEWIANLLIKEAMPDACPENDDGDVGDDHQGDVLK